MYILHHQPVDRLFVFAVNASGLNKLCLDAGDRLWVVIGIKMNCECIDHAGQAGWCFAVTSRNREVPGHVNTKLESSARTNDVGRRAGSNRSDGL